LGFLVVLGCNPRRDFPIHRKWFIGISEAIKLVAVVSFVASSPEFVGKFWLGKVSELVI